MRDWRWLILGGCRCWFRRWGIEGVRVVNAGVVWGGHSEVIGSSCSSGVSEWGNGNGSRSMCRGFLFQRVFDGNSNEGEE